MTIIGGVELSSNSEDWIKVLEDSDGPQEHYEPGRAFFLTRKLTPEELTPLSDMEQACACELHYDYPHLYVDQPLVLIVQAYLTGLDA